MSNLSSPERFTFVDALRGIASLSVFFCHWMLLIGALVESRSVTVWSSTAHDYFALGVQVFFVLSGFVITHSLRHNPLTWRSVGRFMLRRQLRLDPAYWLMLIVILCLQVVLHQPLSSMLQILLNFIYLQNVFQIDSMLGVAWTLCLEVQFYVFFIACLMFGRVLSEKVFVHKSGERKAKGDIGLPTICVIFVTGEASLVVAQVPCGFSEFPRFWFYFVAGVLAYWSFRKVICIGWFLGFQALFVGAIIWAWLARTPYLGMVYTAQKTTPLALCIGCLTAFILWNAGRRDKLTQWGQNAFLQYFGRISYSLYLVHLLVIFGVYWLGIHILNPAWGAAWRHSAIAALLILAIVYSVAAAQFLYVRIEHPSIGFAARFKDEDVSAKEALADEALADEALVATPSRAHRIKTH